MVAQDVGPLVDPGDRDRVPDFRDALHLVEAPEQHQVKPIEFEGQTLLLGPPPGTPRGECGSLPVQVNAGGTFKQTYTSFWKPSDEDLELLRRGAHVRLDVHGGAHPPVWVSIEKCVELP
jgi:hypothetical protein